MSRPIIKIVNVSTGEEIERELNDTEFAQYKVDQESQIAKQAEAAAKATQKAALLERLGISEDEARLLLA
jgi:hypothetical protein